MIFFLNVRIDDLEDLSSDEVEELFTNLVDADRMGRHFVVMRRDICRWASANVSLSGRNMAYLSVIMESFSTRGNICKEARSYLEIVLGGGRPSVEGSGFKIGHRNFNLGEFWQYKSRMIVENLNSDGKLYQYVFDHTVKKTRVPGISVDFVLGAGNTTSSAFEGEINSFRVAVCVVDTDRISPCDRLGNTALKVMNVHSKRNLEPEDDAEPYIGIALKTVGHELENYIPLSAIKKIGEFKCDEQLDDLVFQQTAQNAKDCFWLYFDTKKGLKIAEIQNKVKNNHKSKGVIDWLAQKTMVLDADFDTLEISNIGHTIVERFLNSKEAKTEYLEFTETDYWQAVFFDHFEQLLWFLAAPKGKST